MTGVSNARLDDAEFARERSEVLSQYRSGVGELEEAFAFHRAHMVERNAVRVVEEAYRAGRTLVQPRAGVATIAGERLLLGQLEEAGSAILPVSVDSLTRNLRFPEAAALLGMSTGSASKLNGFPVVSHGVEVTRRLVGAFSRPFMLRANAIDLRLVAETALASGMTGFVSGPMYATLEYSKDVRLEESIRKWQYVFRLIGRYTEAGIPIVEDSIGFSQSGTYSVPALMHVGVVLDALIMAGQGVKHILVYSMNQGALAQDIASCMAVKELADEYLGRCGFPGVQTYVASSHWNGIFPEDPSAAYALIVLNTVVAALARATMVYVKSIEEGIGVPSAEGNAASVRATHATLRLLEGQDLGRNDPDVAFERELNLLEGRAMLDAVLSLGHGDPVLGVIQAFDQGVLDLPLVPSRLARGNVLVVRDARGAARFMDPGQLPLPPQALRMERERLAERERGLGRRLGYLDVVADIQFPALSSAGISGAADARS